jgi:hypothetical protein
MLKKCSWCNWEYDDNNIKEVRIVLGNFWYKDMVGEVIKVIEFDKTDEKYFNHYSYIACGEPSRAMIIMEDAVRV